jgi:phosphoribosylformylglycinamidine (FGAM) synthase-like enzyme
VADDLLDQLRATAQQYTGAKAAAEGLPAGFNQIDDVIVLLQPVRLAAQDEHEALEAILRQLAEKNFLTGTQAVGEGGVWAALINGCATARLGFHAEFSESEGANAIDALITERTGRALVSTRPKAHLPLANFVERRGRFTAEAIGRVTAGDVRVQWMGTTLLEAASLDHIA